MIDDDTIKKMAVQAGFAQIGNLGVSERERAFTRAVWSLGRQAGLEEAAAECERNDLRHAMAVVRALKENKHDR